MIEVVLSKIDQIRSRRSIGLKISIWNGQVGVKRSQSMKLDGHVNQSRRPEDDSGRPLLYEWTGQFWISGPSSLCSKTAQFSSFQLSTFWIRHLHYCRPSSFVHDGHDPEGSTLVEVKYGGTYDSSFFVPSSRKINSGLNQIFFLDYLQSIF